MSTDTINYKEEYEKLKEEMITLQERYFKARDEGIRRGSYAALLSGNKAMMAYRKLSVKAGRDDPFERLRPRLSQAEAGILYNIDNRYYKGDHLVIRGWSYEHGGLIPEIVIRDRSRLLTFDVQRYPRSDVNELLGINGEFLTGFSVRLPLAQIKHPVITFELENELGYVVRELKIILDEKKRAAYIKRHAIPTYAIDSAGYDDWIHDQMVTEEELAREAEVKFAYEPKISIVIPLYNTPEKFLDELMDGLLGQSYGNIEVCLADGSSKDEVEEHVREKYLSDSRVVYQRLAVNAGISGNTNEAIKMATGDFIMLCDHDDTVEKNACYEIVKALNEDPEIDSLYTDEDKIMYTSGVYYSPNFKPDFSPDLLRSNNYITHIFCVRKSIVDEIGGEEQVYERSEFDGAQDYDFILRCVEKSRKVHHIPKFLYHWRAHQTSTAGNPESKMYAYDNGRKAIQAHYDRCGIHATCELAEDIGSYRTRYEIQGEPLVSIIIPNKDFRDVLDRALVSIFEKSTYRNFEIIIAENNSTEPETFAYYEKIQAEHDNVKVIYWKDIFNYSAINNFAVKHARGEYLLFLNNDVEVITDRWIEEMLGYCQRGDVGAVGARMYYPNDKLQHCGIVVGIGGIAGHICHMEKRDSGGYFGRIVKSQDVSAVTAACMMMPRHVFEEVGGFDEEFVVAYNDVDLCLKVRAAGYLVVYDAWAELYHYESLSRGSDDIKKNPEKHERQMREARRLRDRWKDIFENGDPYFNPNLDYDTSDYVLKGTMPPNYSVLQKARNEVIQDDKK